MLAKIIVSSNLIQRTEVIDTLMQKQGLTNSHPDLLLIPDEEKLGVEQAKRIREHLSFKPYSAPGRGVALISSQNLTVDAQNSLLKTLEEPPEQAIILLGLDSQDSLLPTILSRCELVIIDSIHTGIQLAKKNQTLDQTGDDNKGDSQNQYFEKIEELINLDTDSRFSYVEKLDDKKEQFLNALTNFFSNELKKNPQNLAFSKLLIRAQEYKSANGNLRAILEYLMLNLS